GGRVHHDLVGRVRLLVDPEQADGRGRPGQGGQVGHLVEAVAELPGPVLAGDRPYALVVEDRAPDGVGEVHEERLRGFGDVVAVDDDRDGLRGGPGREEEAAGGGHVVDAGGGRPVGGREVHGHVGGGDVGKVHGEDGVDRPRVAFRHGHVVDGDRDPDVIEDDPLALPVRDGGVGGVGQVHEEVLVGLDGGVAADRHRHRPRGDAHGEGQRAGGGDVVAGGGGRAVGGSEGHRDHLPAHGGQGDGEVEVEDTAVPLTVRDVVDGQGGAGVVVLDRALPLAVGHGGVPVVGEVHEERLVRLVEQVPQDGDVQRLGDRARREGQGPGRGRVVGPGGGGPVGCAVVHGDGLSARRAERHGEGRDGRGRVALRHHGVADGQRRRRVVVGDGPHPHPVGDGRVRGVGEVHEEGLVRLVEQVAVHGDADVLRGAAGREGQRPGGGQVVGGRGRGAVGGGVVHRHLLAHSGGEAHREGRGRGARVALRDRDVVDEEDDAGVVVGDG